MVSKKLLDTTLCPPFHVNEKEVSVVLALVKLANNGYEHFDPVTLGLSHDSIAMHSNIIEESFSHISSDGNVRLPYGAISVVSTILTTVDTEYSRFAHFIPMASLDDVDALELKFAEISSSWGRV